MIDVFINEIQSGNTSLFAIAVLLTIIPVLLLTYRNLRKQMHFYNTLVAKGATAKEKAIVYQEAYNFYKRRIRSYKVSAVKFDEADKAWADQRVIKWTIIRVLLELPILLFFLGLLIWLFYF